MKRIRALSLAFIVLGLLWAVALLVFVVPQIGDFTRGLTILEIAIGAYIAVLGPPVLLYGLCRAALGGINLVLRALPTAAGSARACASGLASLKRFDMNAAGPTLTRGLIRVFRVAAGIAVFAVGVWGGIQLFSLGSVPFREYSLMTVAEVLFYAWLAYAMIVWSFHVAFGPPFDARDHREH